MIESPKLFMVLLGATPKGRNIEQHDIFFGIANTLADLLPEMKAFWQDAKIHIDAYRVVGNVDGYAVKVIDKSSDDLPNAENLFFLNLGGYKKGEFEELHYKMLVVAEEKAIAIRQAKETAFYKHTGFKGATSHIDDKYGVDVDDVFAIQDILSPETKGKYTLGFTKADNLPEDEYVLGYIPLTKLS